MLVTVRDSGPGLAPETLERLFEPFYTTKQSGLGLGAADLRFDHRGHRGRLWASANVPRGTVFKSPTKDLIGGEEPHLDHTFV